VGNIIGNGSGLTNVSATTNGLVATNSPLALTLTNANNVFVGNHFDSQGNCLASTNYVNAATAGMVTNNSSGVSLSGTFTGNGAGLTNLNAANLSGTNLIVTNLKTTIQNGNPNTLVVTNGNVGIGTTGPGQALDVNGSIAAVSSDAQTAPLIVSNISAGPSGLYSWVYEGLTPNVVANSGSLFLMGKAKSQNNSGYMSFKYVGAGSTSNQYQWSFYSNDNLMSLWATGNLGVGMGETAPGSKFSSGGNLSVGSTFGAVAAPANGAIIEGNVGIGTTNPAAALAVTGNMTISGNATNTGGSWIGNGSGLTNLQSSNIVTATNAAPTGITWGVTVPDYWIKLTNSSTVGYVWMPCWTNH
jgi:hypothetical protein